MKERTLLPAEIPQRMWPAVLKTPYTEADLAATRQLLDETRRSSELVEELGEVVFDIATRIANYRFGQLTNRRGEKFNDRKRMPSWLISEVECIETNLRLIAEAGLEAFEIYLEISDLPEVGK